MIAYRIAREKYINDLSGYGAYLYDARWTLAGTYALYTAAHKSLAYVEYFARHFERDTWPPDLHLASIEISIPSEIKEVPPSELPETWDRLEYQIECQRVVKRYFKQAVLGIKLPSVFVPGEYNIICNPRHSYFNAAVKVVNVEKLELDKRFFIL